MIQQAALSGSLRRIPAYGLALLMGLLWLSSGFLGFATAVGPLLLGLVVGMGLFVVLAAFAAEKEENLLGVSASHVPNLAFTSASRNGDT